MATPIYTTVLGNQTFPTLEQALHAYLLELQADNNGSPVVVFQHGFGNFMAINRKFLKQQGIELSHVETRDYKAMYCKAMTSPLFSQLDMWVDNLRYTQPKIFPQVVAYLYTTLPTKSVTNPTKLAVYRGGLKLLGDNEFANDEANKKAVISYDKWLNNPSLSVLTQEQKSTLQEMLQTNLATVKDIAPRIQIVGNATQDDYDLWDKAYSTNRIKSCMSYDNRNDYGVARHETWRCWLSSYYGGEDNGIRLVILWNRDKTDIVARAIVVECQETGEKYRSSGNHTNGNKGYYGDNSIAVWLDEHYPIRQAGYKSGIILYSLIKEVGNPCLPYIDGDNSNVSVIDSSWYTITSDGEIDGHSCSGQVYNYSCNHCGCGVYHNDNIVIDTCGEDTILCDNCYHEHTYWVNAEQADMLMYIYDWGTIIIVDDIRYHVDYLDKWGIVQLHDGDYAHKDDCFYCDWENAWFFYDNHYKFSSELVENLWGGLVSDTAVDTWGVEAPAYLGIDDLIPQNKVYSCDIDGVSYEFLCEHIACTVHTLDREHIYLLNADALAEYPCLQEYQALAETQVELWKLEGVEMY